MSGGVDSAVTALLLKDAGYDVQGLFMSNWEEDDAYCTAAQDFQDARAVSTQLKIPLHRVSFAAQYKERVFAHFLSESAAGRTPNPDVLCNREIKFGVCFDYMQRLGATWIATGHYARVRRHASGTELLKARDGAKDQSYFLHAVAGPVLARTVFPLGEFTKKEVRQRAHAAGFGVHDKPDSTGICFIGERPFQEFLARFLPLPAGPIETPEGRIVGEHRGLAAYTLGQRSGLRIGGRAGTDPAPWYVAAKQTDRNVLVVVQDPNHPLLLSSNLLVEHMHWLVPPPVSGRFGCGVKTRYRQMDLPCEVSVSAGGASVQVALHAPARSVTPGQYAVFYDDERCLGGGVIAERSSRRSQAAPLEPHHSPILEYLAEGT